MSSQLIGLLLLIPSMLCAVVPMLVLLGLVWWFDRYEREPIWLFLLTFLWGAIGGVLCALVGSMALDLPASFLPLTPEQLDALATVAFAPLAEEPAKAAFLLIVFWNRGFDNMTDGFVYGAAAGLGFGMTENFTYFASSGFSGDWVSWIELVVIRTFYSAAMHGTATSMVGAAVGFARFRGCATLAICTAGGFMLAMSMHGLWNGLLVLDGLQGGNTWWSIADFIVFPLEAAAVFTVFQLALLEESLTIRRELAEEAERGLIPADHPKILGSWWRRHGRGFLPPGVPHHRYVAAVTALALRKRQLRMIGSQDEYYRDEVFRLRRVVDLLIKRGAPPTASPG